MSAPEAVVLSKQSKQELSNFSTPEAHTRYKARDIALREADEEVLESLHEQTPHFDRLTKAILQELEFHIESGLSPQEALSQIQEDDELRFKHDFPRQPIKSLQWWDLRAMESRRPGNSQRVMTAMRERARQEIVSGLDGMHAVEGAHDTPYQRARYLALIDELSEDWQPRNGIERTLLQQMAQAHFNYLKWQARLRILIDAEKRDGSNREWQPRVSQSQALEQAMNMVDRFQRMFLRTQRALRDMRRYTINVEHVGQLNVAQQQINVLDGDEEKI